MKITAKITGINTSDKLFNLTTVDANGKVFNLKTASSDYKIGGIYIFEVETWQNERVCYQVLTAHYVDDLPVDDQDAVLREFLPASNLSLDETKNIINGYLDKITNKIVLDITKGLLEKYGDKYYIYPAAAKLHHAYVGGLAFHCIGMLKLAEALINCYPYLNQDYLYAGVILHDIGKVVELSGNLNTEYTLDGQLIGHLVIGALEIDKMAQVLGYGFSSEVRMLKHMLISHHGQPQYGAAKKPLTPEAIALYFIDTIDSKFCVLGEELAKTDSGTFTDIIGVLDRIKVYKE